MKKHLLTFFSTFSSLEEQIELIKHILCERSNSNLLPVFHYIDQSNKGYIDSTDLKALLYPTSISEFELHSLIQSWSKSSPHSISYQDFIYFLLPLNFYPKPNLGESISHDLKYSIQRIFYKEAEFVSGFSDIKKKFKAKVKNLILDAFDLISKGQNYFDRRELWGFLRENGLYASESVVFAMFRRLDKDSDGLVSISDFVKCFGEEEEEVGNLDFKRKVEDLSGVTRETYTVPSGMTRTKRGTELKKLLKGFIRQEKVLDGYREEICFRADYSPQSVFAVFDKKKKKFVSELEFDKGLRDFGIRTSAANVFLLFRHYDTDGDGVLLYENFYEMLAPRSQPHKGLLKYRDRFQLSLETNSLLTQIFTLILEIEQNAERLRSQVVGQDCSWQELFEIVDTDGKGVATVNDFREMLKRYKIQPTINDLGSLFSRFDTNEDGIVTFNEFYQQLNPRVSRM